MKTVDITGNVYGKLTALEFAASTIAFRRPLWRCRCECGREVLIRKTSLVNGLSKSCGCSVLIHGEGHDKQTKEYRAWRGMRSRCLPGDKEFALYGGRGIKVCDRWNSYLNFLADMGRAPSKKHSIDRIDVNGNYEPANCRWATLEVQLNNKRNNRYINFEGETLTIAQLSKRFNVPHSRLLGRINNGWPVELAVSMKSVRGVRMVNMFA